MAVKVAINGFGRIGRLAFRQMFGDVYKRQVYMIDLRYFNMKPAEFAKSREITDILVLYQIPGFAKDGNLFKMVR